ncbi:MAG: trehalase family glycosidase [Opitutus sp.]
MQPFQGLPTFPAARGLLRRLGAAGLAAALISATAAVPDDWSALRHEADTAGKPAWRPMLRYMAALHDLATHPPAPPFEFPWEEIGPGYGYGPAFGHWDIVHAMIDVLPARPAHMRRQLLNDLRLQLPNGFLPGSIYMPGSPSAPGGPTADKGKPVFDTGTQSHPPLWPVAAEDYMELTGDTALRRECFERVTRQIAWFESARQAEPDGFFYNDILLHKWESGVDEGVRFDDTTMGARACIDATAHVYWMCDYAARWARQLGEDDGPWLARADRLGEFMRTKLWDERSGFFYDIWAVDNPGMQRAAFEGMWPVVVGAATPAQAKRVIDEWLLNPRRFFTKHPIATVGASDPKFELRMWRGPAWNSMTYWAARGCVRYGRPDAARALLEAALDDTAAQFDRTGTIWEFFHPQGGRPEDVARKPHTKRNHPWTDYVGHNPLFAMARLWKECR